jgi:hypothetical protein
MKAQWRYQDSVCRYAIAAPMSSHPQQFGGHAFTPIGVNVQSEESVRLWEAAIPKLNRKWK